MNKGIINISVVPVRKEASDASEMITQAIFGELLEVLEVKNQWVKIVLHDDHYEGWIDNKQFSGLEDSQFEIFKTTPKFFLAEYINFATNQTHLPVTLTLGTQLPFYDNTQCVVDEKYTIDAECISEQQPKDKIVEISHLYINTPYLWGGKTVFGIDCSGFSQMVYKICGYSIPRDAYQQAELGTALSFIEEAEPGDLAFFDNAEGKIIHVGILLSNNRIIHAHGKVRIDVLDYTGIFNQEYGKHTHKLRVIKRIIE